MRAGRSAGDVAWGTDAIAGTVDAASAAAESQDLVLLIGSSIGAIVGTDARNIRVRRQHSHLRDI